MIIHSSGSASDHEDKGSDSDNTEQMEEFVEEAKRMMVIFIFFEKLFCWK